MKTKPAENNKITTEWVCYGKGPYGDHPEICAIELEKHIKIQKLFEDRMKEVEDYEHYLEFSKKAPSKEKQADFLEKMYGLLLNFARNLVLDEKWNYENHERPTEQENERLKHQPFN